MNMFRDIAMFTLIALGAGLMFSDPTTWNWVTLGGEHAVTAVMFLDKARPFSEIVCFALALALFMTRLKF